MHLAAVSNIPRAWLQDFEFLMHLSLLVISTILSNCES